MKQVNRSVVVAFVVGALTLAGVGAMAAAPQFRESVIVRGTVGGVTGDHQLTFSGPVSLPGLALAPGTYIFRRPAGNMLRVTNATNQPYALLMTRPVNRSRSDRYEIVLGAPLADGSPRRIRSVVRPWRVDRPGADLPRDPVGPTQAGAPSLNLCASDLCVLCLLCVLGW